MRGRLSWRWNYWNHHFSAEGVRCACVGHFGAPKAAIRRVACALEILL
jgi:hypothetical protein